MVAAEEQVSRFKVHISHCDADSGLVSKLSKALRDQGRFEVSTANDKRPLKRNWKSRFADLIADADTILIVLSPDAIGSEALIWQIERAHELSKQIISVMARPLRNVKLPGELAPRWQFCLDDTRSFANGVQSLVHALDTTADWIRTHTLLYARARAWLDGDRSAQLLLSGPDVAAAKVWTFERPRDAPKPTSLHLEFIQASEQANTGFRNGNSGQHARLTETATPTPFLAEKKRARRKTTLAKFATTKHGSELDSKFADSDADEPKAAPSSDTLRAGAIRAQHTKGPVQVVLGATLVILAGAATWQALTIAVHAPPTATQASLQPDVSTAQTDRLFLDQASRIEQVLNKIDCLLDQSSDEVTDCQNPDDRPSNHVLATMPGDFDK